MAKSIGKLWEYVKIFFSFTEVTETGDDAGVIFTEQVSIGTKDNGKESVFGEGDSYPVEIAFKYDVANEVGNVITGAVDETVSWQSDTASNAPMFTNGNIGQVVMIGSERPRLGVKMKYTSLGSIAAEPENIVGEFLNDINVWEEELYMSSDSNYPHDQHGWEIASNLSEHIRFGMNPADPLDTNWAAQTLNINGVDHTMYWARFRIVAAITASPVLEQIKHNTNKAEKNATGLEELFGLARREVTLQEGLRGIIANGLNDPKDQTVQYCTDISAKYKENKWENTKKDGFLLIQNFTKGLDTSIPLQLSLSFYVDGANTGDIEFTVSSKQVSQNYLYNQAIPADTLETKIVTVAAPSQNVRQTVSFEIPINKVGIEGGGVVISALRDAEANPNDDIGANIVITNALLIGYEWK